MYPDMSQHQSHQGLHGNRKNSDFIESGKSLRESLRRLKSGMCQSFTKTTCSLLIFIFMVELLFWNTSMQGSQTSLEGLTLVILHLESVSVKVGV